MLMNIMYQILDINSPELDTFLVVILLREYDCCEFKPTERPMLPPAGAESVPLFIF